MSAIKGGCGRCMGPRYCDACIDADADNAIEDAQRYTAEHLLDASLGHVESDSIRAWVNTPRNRPIWLEIAVRTVRKQGDAADPVAFAAYVVCVAIGA